jgi:hypothetical protein
MESRFAGKKLCQRALDDFLNTRADLLNLPALVGGAVVGDGEFELTFVHGVGNQFKLSR